jgi:hypothetical protein
MQFQKALFIKITTNKLDNGGAGADEIGIHNDITQQNPRSRGGFCLTNQVREQSHEASALDGVRELALVPGADAGALARNDFAEGREVTLKRFRVLVVDGLGVDLAKVTGLRFAGGEFHRWGHAQPEQSDACGKNK